MAKPTLATRISNKAFRAKKLLHWAFSRHEGEPAILLIMGCQRSGTTLLSEVFHKDLDTKSFGEFSELTSEDSVENIRLNPLDDVAGVIGKVNAPFVVVKPLVESQRARELLDFFPNSHVLWVYRNFRDVANSNIRKFGLQNGMKDLRPIVNDEPGNWRSDKVSADTRAIVCSNFSESMNPADAHILVWYTRNVLFFEQNLEEHPNVMLCRYEELTASPAAVIRSIYGRLKRPYPGDSVVSDIHASSVGAGAELVFSPGIEELGHRLLDRLDTLYHAKYRPSNQ